MLRHATVAILLLALLAPSIYAARYTVDDIFVSLEKNDAAGESIFTVNNPNNQPFNLSKLTIWWNITKGGINGYSLSVNTTCLRVEPRYSTVLTSYYTDQGLPNESIHWYNASVANGTTTTPYECFKEGINVPPGRSKVRLRGNPILTQQPDGTWAYSMDWVPTIEFGGTNYTKTEWEWWNASYEARYPINMSLADPEWPLEVNGSTGINIGGSIQHLYTAPRGGTYLYIHNATTYTVANDTGPVPFIITNGTGTDYNRYALGTSPDMWLSWTYDENATGAADLFGRRNGTRTGTLITANRSGYSGNGRSLQQPTFTTTNDYISPTDNLPGFGETTSWSIESWVNYPRAGANTGSMALLGEKAVTNKFICLYGQGIGGAGYISVSCAKENVAWGASVTALNAIVVNTWYHVVATYDGSTKNLTVYINNTYQGSAIFTATGTIPSTFPLRAFSTINYGDLNGTMDSLTYYNRTLTAADVSSRFNNARNTRGYGNLEAMETNSIESICDCPASGDWYAGGCTISASCAMNGNLIANGTITITSGAIITGCHKIVANYSTSILKAVDGVVKCS